MKVFYFTGTGNSLYVAKRIGEEIYSIPQMIKEGRYEFEDEAIGFVYPCYGFGMAKIITNFIKKSKFKANYFFAIMTYGAMPLSGLKQIEIAGKEAGIEFNYINEILMIDNYLPAFKMEDQLEKEESKNIEKNLNEIVEDISKRKNKLISKGIVSNTLSKCANMYAVKMSNNYGNKNFIVNDNCTSCKVCEKVCPANNIKVSKKPKFLHKCETCFACIHHCPQNSIHLKAEKGTSRFINPNVKLKEIIDANN
jgi:NAD-dependent dihydropyrimidine dehydrogenase PreA subunit/flavodoxin